MNDNEKKDLALQLAGFLSRVLNDSSAMFRKAQILAHRSQDHAALRVLMQDVSFRSLVAHVSEIHRWIREQAKPGDVVGVTPADGLTALLRATYPDFDDAPLVPASQIGERK